MLLGNHSRGPGVVAGSSAQNFSLQSSGTGAAKKYSMTFKGEPSPTPITFLSYKTTQWEDGLFCGPVIDGVILSASHGHKSNLQLIFLFAFSCSPSTNELVTMTALAELFRNQVQ